MMSGEIVGPMGDGGVAHQGLDDVAQVDLSGAIIAAGCHFQHLLLCIERWGRLRLRLRLRWYVLSHFADPFVYMQSAS